MVKYPLQRVEVNLGTFRGLDAVKSMLVNEDVVREGFLDAVRDQLEKNFVLAWTSDANHYVWIDSKPDVLEVNIKVRFLVDQSVGSVVPQDALSDRAWAESHSVIEEL